MKKLFKDPELQRMYEHIAAMFIMTWLLMIFLAVLILT